MALDLGHGVGGVLWIVEPPALGRALLSCGASSAECGMWERSPRGCSATPPVPVHQQVTSLLVGWLLVGLFWGWAVLSSGRLHKGVLGQGEER